MEKSVKFCSANFLLIDHYEMLWQRACCICIPNWNFFEVSLYSLSKSIPCHSIVPCRERVPGSLCSRKVLVSEGVNAQPAWTHCKRAVSASKELVLWNNSGWKGPLVQTPLLIPGPTSQIAQGCVRSSFECLRGRYPAASLGTCLIAWGIRFHL